MAARPLHYRVALAELGLDLENVVDIRSGEFAPLFHVVFGKAVCPHCGAPYFKLWNDPRGCQVVLLCLGCTTAHFLSHNYLKHRLTPIEYDRLFNDILASASVSTPAP